MPLSPGSSLGPYEIIAPLGAGGMGEVYRARDTRLGREVAIKVLPGSFSDDPERLRRFEQEARATGMLNHPNILVVHDFGTHQGSPYLVTELLEGQTLREELPVSRRKALDWARQIATGLAAAHAKGVTHRDLKPENLFVTTDGRVKILDFGLAKVAAPEVDALAATRTAGTATGIALGTIGYMSPEQALGKPIDHRSDIFTFGAILYEMFSGARAFQAPSGIETLNAILKADPPPLADAALERIVRRCLEKSPEQRFQSAADLSFGLEALSGSSSSTTAQAASGKSVKTWSTTLAISAAVIALAAGVAAGLWWHARQDAAASGWAGVRLGGPDFTEGARISSNGQSLAFAADVDGQCQVGVMNPHSGDWSVVTHERANGYVWNLSWSPDSSKIYFERDSGASKSIFAIPALGGEEQLVLEDAGLPEALPDGSLIVVRVNAERKQQLHHYWPQNGRLEPLGGEIALTLNGSMRPTSDGRAIVFFGRPLPLPAPETPFGYYALDLATNKVRQIAPQMENPFGYMAASPGSPSVLLTQRVGDLLKIVEAPLHGAGSPRLVMDWRFTFAVTIDAASDGSLYLNELDRPMDVLRFPTAGGVPERVSGGSALGRGPEQLLETPDGRVIFPVTFSGHVRLHAAKPGKAPHAFVQTDEDTSWPMALLGSTSLVINIGKLNDPASWMLAVVSLSDGRIIRRLDATKGLTLDSLSPAIDGKTLYYTASGSVWAIAADGAGAPRKLVPGDGVVVDPNGRDFIVFRNEKDAARLFRVPIAGGAEEAISIPGNLRLAMPPLSNAINKDGRILMTVDSLDSCWERTAILDPRTGKAERIQVPFSGDIWSPAWTPDGRILAQGLQARTALWRFAREKK